MGTKKGTSKEEILKAIEKYWTACVEITNPEPPQLSVPSKECQPRPASRYCEYHNFTSKNLRVFSIDAVEYFDEDLQYVKNGDRLYISTGTGRLT
jgi:hypothetical protein